MIRLLLAVLLLVVIQVVEGPEPIACPAPALRLVRIGDGVYQHFSETTTLALSCWSKPVTRTEEWTDYPERGGAFIRALSTEPAK